MMLHWLHTLIDVVGTVGLLAALAAIVWVLELERQERIARRRQSGHQRIDHAPVEHEVPPWSLEKPELEVWLEARAAADRAAEDPPAYD